MSNNMLRAKLSRHMALTLATVLIGELAALASPTPAIAQGVNLAQCTGTQTITFSPALTNTTQQVTETIVDNLPLCVDGDGNLLEGASATNTVTRDYSCEQLLGGGTGTRIFNWTNNTSSTYNYVSEVDIVDGNLQVISTGTITAGRFAGSSATGDGVFSPLLGGDITASCSGSGVTEIEGPYTFIVLPL